MSFAIAHNSGKMNTAAEFLSPLQSIPNRKIILQNKEHLQTQAIEINIESTGISHTDQFLSHTEDVQLPPEEQLWQQKKKKRHVLDTKLSAVIIVPH